MRNVEGLVIGGWYGHPSLKCYNDIPLMLFAWGFGLQYSNLLTLSDWDNEYS